MAVTGEFKPPKTKIATVNDIIHGHRVADKYQWLEDKKNPEVIAWTKAQHEFTLDFVEQTTAEIQGLNEEFTALLDRDIFSAPFFKGERQFFFARKKGEPQNKLYTRINGADRIVFDPLSLDSTGKTAIMRVVFVKDGSKVAIGLQSKGAEISDFYIVDTETGALLGDPIRGLINFEWTDDERHAYVTFRTKEMIERQMPLKTYRHKLGDDHANDDFLLAPDDAKYVTDVFDTEEGGLTFYSIGDFYSNTLLVKKIGDPGEPQQIYASSEFRSTPKVAGDFIYFYTNYQAPNYKIMRTAIEAPHFEQWEDFIPEKDTMLVQFQITSQFVIVQDKKDIESRLFAYSFAGDLVREIPLPIPGVIGSMTYHKHSDTVFVTIMSYTNPSCVYKLDGVALEWEFFHQDESPIDTANLVSELVFYESHDGVKAPMYIIRRKDMQLHSANPTLLYGYGGFNAGLSPSFIGLAASFVNRGGVYALAGIRGGNEYGEKWHRGGMLEKKQNTFNDFIAAAEYLIAQKYTVPEKLAIKGGSNGGLLIGAALTQRPELFKTAICAVPLLDMIRFHKFLIARYWIAEYGDPDNEKDFNVILQYSPYHNIKPDVNLPTTFVIAGENDSRVDPLHAKKFVAALQNNPGQSNPILLFMNYDGGHGSGKPIPKAIQDNEREWRFLMNQLGMAG